MAAMAKSKVDPTKSIPPEEIDMDGILISDEFLALPKKELSLEAKLIYLIIRRELRSKNQTFTSLLTDKRLAKMLGGITKRTVQNKLTELDEKGYIAIASRNRATERDKKGIPSEIRGIRWIYLDRKLAGYRKRAINNAKSKKPVEFLYSLLVLEKGVPQEVYVRAMKEAAAGRRRRQEQEVEHLYFAAFRESLADMTDEQVAELEKLQEESPGTYLKLKQEYLKAHQPLSDTDDDGLFDLDDESDAGDLDGDL